MSYIVRRILPARYVAIAGSGHACCFDASVVDTSKPKHSEGEYETVCECFEIADAEQIAAALNRHAA